MRTKHNQKWIIPTCWSCKHPLIRTEEICNGLNSVWKCPECGASFLWHKDFDMRTVNAHRFADGSRKLAAADLSKITIPSEPINYRDFGIDRRTCNEYGCGGRMRRTFELQTFGNCTPSENPHAIFRCIICGKENYWLLDPDLDGSYGHLHKLKGERAYSGYSMMSDPRFYPPKSPAVITEQPKRTRTKYNNPPNPSPMELNVVEKRPVFAYADNSTKPTHRWHYGREEWVKL